MHVTFNHLTLIDRHLQFYENQFTFGLGNFNTVDLKLYNIIDNITC